MVWSFDEREVGRNEVGLGFCVGHVTWRAWLRLAQGHFEQRAKTDFTVGSRYP